MTDLFGIEGYAQRIPPNIPSVRGSIIIPSRRTYESASARGFRKVRYRSRLLLDPQIYLIQLDPVRCETCCARLATYDWFPKGDLNSKRTGRSAAPKKWIDKSKKIVKDYWTGELPTGDDIDVAQRSVATANLTIGCEAVILAAPLTVNPNSDFRVEIEWLDRGILAARAAAFTIPLPIIATVALSDRVLTGIDPFDNALIETIVDQVSTRAIDGVYIVLESSTVTAYYLADRDAVGALMRLVDAFKRAGIRRVIVNYATVAGLLAVVAGADTLCTGWYRSERRLRFDELPDVESEGGIAFPAYYSHPLASEIQVGDDLMKIAKAGKLEDIADETKFSEGLLRALRSGKKPGDVPQWEYRAGNHTVARGHFYSAIGREVDVLQPLGQEQRYNYAQKWLDRAARLADELAQLSEAPHDRLNARTELTHQRGWKTAFEKFVKNRGK
jgi:hypothetical protein